MRGSFRCILAFLLGLTFVHGAEVALTVTGEVKAPLKLSMAELKDMEAVKVAIKSPDGNTNTYEGVKLHEILRRAEVPLGDALRGPALTLCLLVKATDGYQVAFSLPELDPAFTTRQAVLAYRRDDMDLPSNAGPLRLVIPDEKRQSRSVRQVTELEILRIGESKSKESSKP